MGCGVDATWKRFCVASHENSKLPCVRCGVQSESRGAFGVKYTPVIPESLDEGKIYRISLTLFILVAC